jgi:uncharacterized protein (DUF2236 family)
MSRVSEWLNTAVHANEEVCCPMQRDVVSREDLERELRTIEALVPGQTEGVFGPASLTWRVNREAAIFLAAGRALLLQLAHPYVAAAIAEHSRTLADPIGRFHRTFKITFTLVFGALDQALRTARHLHQRHSAIQGVLPKAVGPFAAGTRYRANDVAALRWVHATLIESALMAHDLVLPAMAAQERELYYGESRRFAALFGVPASALPPDWTGFARYCEAMRQPHSLVVSDAARAIAAEIFAGAGLWVRAPRWYMALTAQMLPPHLREQFELRDRDVEPHIAAQAVSWARRIYPALPERLRHVGPYQEAMARLAGRARPDLATRLINRLWIGQGSMT